MPFKLDFCENTQFSLTVQEKSSKLLLSHQDRSTQEKFIIENEKYIYSYN